MRIAFMVLAFALFLGVEGSADTRFFSVRDSIEMVRFDRVEPKVQFSPDNRYFAIVTSRGIIRSNTVESTIWLFSTPQVQRFAWGLKSDSVSPKPLPLARIVVTPEINYFNSYEPVIFALQWLPNSKGLLFLAQGRTSELRLYQTDVVSGLMHVLTPAGYDVLHFTSAPASIFYEIAPHHVSRDIGEPINADATDVTGMPLNTGAEPLYSILFPHDKLFYNDSPLWSILLRGYPSSRHGRAYVIHNGKVRNIKGNWSSVIARLVKNLTQGPPALSVSVRQDLNTPPMLWVTDLHTHVTKKLWNPNLQLARMSLGKASLFRWRDVSGHEWLGELVKPPNYIHGERYPFVIQTHGSSEEEQEFLTDGSYTTAMAARPLAAAGIIVLQMAENRTHGNSPEEIPDQVRGYESAVAQLDAGGLIDPKRVGIIGFSVTGQYVMNALVKHPQLFAAASLTEANDASYMTYMVWAHGYYDKFYGVSPFGKGLATWVKEAPDFNLGAVQTPLLLSANQAFQVLNEWETYVAMRLQKKPVDLMYIRDGQHILQKPLDRLASQQGNVDWFRFWLQGYEDPDPTKAAQYARWRELRSERDAELLR